MVGLDGMFSLNWEQSHVLSTYSVIAASMSSIAGGNGPRTNATKAPL